MFLRNAISLASATAVCYNSHACTTVKSFVYQGSVTDIDLACSPLGIPDSASLTEAYTKKDIAQAFALIGASVR